MRIDVKAIELSIARAAVGRRSRRAQKWLMARNTEILGDNRRVAIFRSQIDQLESIVDSLKEKSDSATVSFVTWV